MSENGSDARQRRRRAIIAQFRVKGNLVVSLLIGLLFLFLVFYKIDLGEVYESILGVRTVYFIPILILFTLLQVIRTYRWGFILRKDKRIGFRSLFSINSIGFMAINIMPVRLGELARPYLLVEKEEMAFGSGLASIVIERLFDMMSVMFMFLLSVILIDISPEKLPLGNFEIPFEEIIKGTKIFIAAGLLPVILFFILLIIFRDGILGFMKRLLTPLSRRLTERVLSFLGRFVESLHVLKSPLEIAYLLLLSLFIWLLTAVGIHLFSISFGFDSAHGLDLWDATFILSLTMVGIAIPGPPGFAGNFEAFCVAGLLVFGITRESSSAFAILLHFSQLIYIVILGLYFLIRDRISFRNLIPSRRPGTSSGSAGACG